MLENLTLDRYPVGIAAIILLVTAVLFCQAIIKNLISHATLRKAHEVGGYYLALVGTVYGILLGLVVLDVITKCQAAERTVNTEAKSLLAVYSLSGPIPE